jgi:hypothetical protein
MRHPGLRAVKKRTVFNKGAKKELKRPAHKVVKLGQGLVHGGRAAFCGQYQQPLSQKQRSQAVYLRPYHQGGTVGVLGPKNPCINAALHNSDHLCEGRAAARPRCSPGASLRRYHRPAHNEHQFKQFGVPKSKAQQLLAEGAQLLGRVLDGRYRTQLLRHLAESLGLQSQQKLVFILKIAVDGSRAVLDGIGNVAHTHLLKPLLDEQVQRRIQDSLAAFGFFAQFAVGDGLSC